MPKKQIDYIIALDISEKEIIRQEALLMSLANKMIAIKDIIDSSTKNELNHYCEKYDGFYYYIKLLEMLAQGCAEGAFKDMLN